MLPPLGGSIWSWLNEVIIEYASELDHIMVALAEVRLSGFAFRPEDALKPSHFAEPTAHIARALWSRSLN